MPLSEIIKREMEQRNGTPWRDPWVHSLLIPDLDMTEQSPWGGLRLNHALFHATCRDTFGYFPMLRIEGEQLFAMFKRPEDVGLFKLTFAEWWMR